MMPIEMIRSSPLWQLIGIYFSIKLGFFMAVEADGVFLPMCSPPNGRPGTTPAS